MLISIDKLASRYHLLPSEVLKKATTFDLQCLDIGVRYPVIEEQKRNGTYKPAVKQLSEQQMKAMLKSVRDGQNKKKKV